ncbi:hypothetical protein BH11BAC7_BH11BAC7_33130 [soil metagenome]
MEVFLKPRAGIDSRVSGGNANFGGRFRVPGTTGINTAVLTIADGGGTGSNYGIFAESLPFSPTVPGNNWAGWTNCRHEENGKNELIDKFRINFNNRKYLIGV